MDDTRTIEAGPAGGDEPAAAREPRMDPPPAIGRDERRMHVRAYNFWVSLLDGRPFPAVEDFDPAQVADFGDHGVLLDFTDGPEDPAISFLGQALRIESGLSGTVARVSDVPGRTLLSRLTDNYLQIIANRAPIGFEAEFVNVRGNTSLYRGILMPFASDGATIDHVYGVINWKELADANTALSLAIEVGGAIGARAPVQPPRPVTPWADGPASQLPAPDLHAHDAPPEAAPPPPESSAAAATREDMSALADRLAAARGTVDQLRVADVRTRSALYRAIGTAYDFACAAADHPRALARLLAEAGVRRQRRAPMTAVAKLVFGADYDKTRLTEFACALAHGRRLGVPSGGMRRLLEGSEGGLKAIVAAEREARRPNGTQPSPQEQARAQLRAARSLAVLPAPGEEEFVLLVARRRANGKVAVVAHVPAEAGLVDRAIRLLPPR